MDEMVTTTEGARLLHLTRRGVQSAVVRGRLHAEKHGKRWYISAKEVERYRVFHLHEQASIAPMPVGPTHRKRRGGGRRKRGDGS